MATLRRSEEEAKRTGGAVMSTAATITTSRDRLVLARLAWAGPPVLLVSLAANLALRALALGPLQVARQFRPLAGPQLVIMNTTLGVMGALATYALVRWLSTRSRQMFRWLVTGAVLFLSVATFVVLGSALTLLSGVAGAVLANIAAPGLQQRPLQMFQVLAGIMLVVSLVPDLTLLTGPAPSAVVQTWHVTTAAVGTLMTMHLTTATIAVGVLSTRAVGGR